MGKLSSEQREQLEGVASAPPEPAGPLAPWKLSVAVAVSAALTGLPLYDAAMTGLAVDMALLRSFGVAFVVWMAMGFANRILLQAERAEGDVVAVPTVSPKPYVDERTGDAGSPLA